MSITEREAPVTAALLPTAEQAALDRCEAVIARGVQTFIEVGEALAEIRDAKLYRTHYDTWEEYCTDRWGIGRARAYQLISAAVVTREMSTVVDNPPANEREARAIAKAAPADRPHAIRRATELAGDGTRTAAHVAQAVQEIAQPDLPIDFSIVQHRLKMHGIKLRHDDGTFTLLDRAGAESRSRVWEQVRDRLSLLEDGMEDTEAETAPARSEGAAPTLDQLDAALPKALSDAGYFWQSATPPTIRHNDGWQADAPTADQALALVRTRIDATSEPITVFPSLNVMECKALIREAQQFIASGLDRKLPTIGQALRIAARMALEVTE